MKAILILDIDERIALNDLKPEEILFYWNGFPLGMKINKCVLKPMPQKKKVRDINTVGWNACVDEILGEEE